MEWDQFTILNVASSSDRGRLWAAVIFAYIFAAYFCQLFYAEYDRFSTLRLSYLAKVLLSCGMLLVYSVVRCRRMR
jgi:hypothetical protein